MLDDLLKAGFCGLITCENPEHGVFTRHSTVRALYSTDRWQLLFSSHCASACPNLDGPVDPNTDTPGLFPQKDSVWLVANMPVDSSLPQCKNACRMRIPSTSLHRLVVSRPASRHLHPGQSVLRTDDPRRSMLPLGIMQHLWRQHLTWISRTDTSDTHCSICGQSSSSSDDPLIICDSQGCQRVQHRSCSNLDKVPPRADWFCLMCQMRAQIRAGS